MGYGRIAVVSVIVAFVALVIVLAPGTSAKPPRYMAAPDAPGSVWRINMDTGELEHCSLVKGGCDVVDRND